MPLTQFEKITLITITIPLTLSPLSLLFLVRLGGYTVNLYVFYFYKLIGKLTVFLEFNLRNMTVTCFTFVPQLSHHSSKRKWATFSLKLQYYGLF
jgi:hypothetical protein